MGLEDLDRLDAAFSGTAPAKAGGDFTPIPEGTKVKLVVMNQKPAIVGANQTPVAKVTFEVVEPAQYAPKKVWHDFWLTEANAKYLKRDLIILGWPGLKPDGGPVEGYKISQLIRNEDHSLMGLGAEVTLGIEPYDHTDPTTGEVQPRLKNIIKFFNSTFKYVPPAGADKAGKPAQPPPPPPKTDPIPF